MASFGEHPHRRFNPLTGEYLLVSPHRNARPWLGSEESPTSDSIPQYLSSCYLCPGNTRVRGKVNPSYSDVYVFENDFPAVLPQNLEKNDHQDHELLRSEGVAGVCRVICFSPRHDLTLPEMEPEAIRKVVDVWAHEFQTLNETWKWVQIFENKGTAMGCSNPHPHGQIWALDVLPAQALKEDETQRNWLAEKGRPMLMDYVQLELERGERLVSTNEHWIAVVPFWAVWPFEMMLLPRRQVSCLHHLTSPERDALTHILKDMLTRYDNLFQTAFPYSMGWHGAPSHQHHHWTLHAHFYPPLLRSASVRKFMVGFEMLGEAQRDLTPEQAAACLRSLSPVHYKHKQRPYSCD